MFTSQDPDKAAKSFQPYAPKAATLADLEAMARYHPSSSPRRRSAETGTEGICRRS